jgi:hypothetical protein
MAKKLKPYVRFDAKWQIVPGSLVMRIEKPKDGRWGELTLVTTSTTTTATPTTTTTTTV